MQTLIRPAILFAMLAVAIPAPAVTAPTQSPFSGTWKLDLAKSKFGSHPEKSETRVYAVTGNKVTLTSKGTDGAGKPTGYHYSAAYDGKPYPLVGNPIGDWISLKMIDPHSVASTVSKDKVVASTSTAAVSPDGKWLTLTRKYPKLATDVSVYARQ